MGKNIFVSLKKQRKRRPTNELAWVPSQTSDSMSAFFQVVQFTQDSPKGIKCSKFIHSANICEIQRHSFIPSCELLGIGTTYLPSVPDTEKADNIHFMKTWMQLFQPHQFSCVLFHSHHFSNSCGIFIVFDLFSERGK